jgi:hypothetical protein
MRLQERILVPCARLHVLPARAEHVLACVDQLLRVLDRVLVHEVGGQERILADASSDAASRLLVELIGFKRNAGVLACVGLM